MEKGQETEAVSYTHLDVYKRQVLGIILSFKYCLKLNNEVVLINVCELGQDGNKWSKFDK